MEKINKNKIIFLFYSIIIVIYFISIYSMFGDDIPNLKIAKTTNIFDYVYSMYFEWGPRVFMHFIMFNIYKYNLLVWKIISISLNLFIFYFLIFKIFKSTNYFITLFFFSLFFLIDWNIIYTSAGWVATTLNYLWPLAFFFISIFPYYSDKINKSNLLHIIIFIPFIILSGNIELTLFSMLTFSFYITYTKWKFKFELYDFIYIFFTALSFLLIVYCPGTKFRLITETFNFFPYYNDLSLIQKFAFCINSIFNLFIGSSNILFITTSLLNFIYIYKFNKNVLYKFIITIPSIIFLLFGILRESFTLKLFPNFILLYNNSDKFGGVRIYEQFDSIQNVVTISIMLIIIICYLYSFILIFNRIEIKYFLLTIFAGFGGLVIAFFTPSLYVISSRVVMFFYISIVLISTSVFKKLIKKMEIDGLFFFISLIFIVSLLNIFNQILAHN